MVKGPKRDTPLFILSRTDLYDYGRCPKIVAYKAYRSLRVERRPIEEVSAAPSESTVIGKIGEFAIAAGFQGGGIPSSVELDSRVVERLEDVGIQVDDRVREILVETTKGLPEILTEVQEAYGYLKIIGKGVSRSGFLPSQANPDFVAVTSTGLPVIIETKNTKAKGPAHEFQTAFYNTLARETGVVVIDSGVQNGKLILEPSAIHDVKTESVLIYPRLQEYERVTRTVDLSQERIEEVWRSKQLGYLGEEPFNDCDSKCPHHRLKMELQEGNLEVAAPLPVTFAKGAVESGADLDARFLYDYKRRMGIAELIERAKRIGKIDSLVSKMVQKGTISSSLANRLASLEYSDINWPNTESVAKEMESQIEPWFEIMGKKRLKESGTGIMGLATRHFTLPNESKRFVKRSNESWEL